MPAPDLISLTCVDKRFANGVHALDAVDLRVGPGEFVSLLGPSGCGKSTVLRLIAGLDSASGGQVLTPASGHGGPPATAFVFQEPTLMPWARVFDNVWLPLRLAGTSRADAAPAVWAALQLVGLREFASAFPAELSGGMKMRASIARALVTRPSVMLMDEPFAALDELTRQRLNDDLLASWQANRFATVFVTHSVFEAAYLSQRVLVMGPRPGRVVAEVAVDAPYPRTSEFRTSARYLDACRALSRQLELAMAEEKAP